jgi:hypothetical protein
VGRALLPASRAQLGKVFSRQQKSLAAFLLGQGNFLIDPGFNL